MKSFLKGMSVITLALLIFPVVPWMIGAVSQEEAVPAVAETAVDEPENAFGISEVAVYDEVKKRETVLTAEEYVAAAVAAQLSPKSEKELLKAQAVLMYTYILKRREEELESPTPELYGCLVSSDTSKYPRLILGDEETVDFDVYREAARAVKDVYLSYGGEPISVAFCRSAGIKTESAETVLGVDIPYLKATDTNEPDAFITTVSYTSEEVFARLTTSDEGYVLLGNPEGWIKEKAAEADGYVKEVYLDSRFVVSGSEIAKLLNLPSAKFTFRYSKATGRFTFTVSGSGSLVGMSQRGAAVMAKEGRTYDEILRHYFKGAEVVGGMSASVGEEQ